MTMQLGAVAPDFKANTPEGPIRFHDWLGWLGMGSGAVVAAPVNVKLGGG